MSGASNWPPALKAYVNETFAKCTDANRAAVEAELKGLIFKAFASDKLWTIDWANVKLESVNPTKKRKVFVPNLAHSFAVTNASTAAETDRRDKRARRFEDDSSPSSSNGNDAGDRKLHKSSLGLNARLHQVMSAGGSRSTPEPEGVYDPNVLDWDNQTVVGTSSRLEKPFLRLTSVPDPSTIRPLPVLAKTLELLKAKWRDESNYGYICDQFKSMRQDLTVQRIKNDFTCTVYEIHARIALEKGDLGEFNQCQGQLRELYKRGLSGHVMEFLGYRILYLLYSRNRAELNNTLAQLTEAERSDPSVEHALAVRHAIAQGNYVQLFRLFCAAPRMGAYLMDHLVPRERVQALVVMTKAYQRVPLSLITSQLAFDSLEDADTFLTTLNAATYVVPPPPSPAIPLADRLVDSRMAHLSLVAALAKYGAVDLKGQI